MKMGMYDTVGIDYPLPGCNSRDIEWQTKDLVCELKEYYIVESGKLVTGGGDTEYHGWLNVYGTVNDRDWYEYDIKFTDGVVVEVRRTEGEDTNHA